MLLKAMKIFAIAMLINTSSAVPALADNGLPLSTANTIASQGLGAISTLLSAERYSVKKGQPYDESNDPAFKSSAGGPEQSSPQHGYFAVPLIVIGLAGILLYFSRFD